jgi:hypothetical protein
MTFTNTKSVENDWYWHEVWGEANRQVKYQVNDQLDDQVFYQINPIKYEIDQEIDK